MLHFKSFASEENFVCAIAIYTRLNECLFEMFSPQIVIELGPLSVQNTGVVHLRVLIKKRMMISV